MQHVHTVPKIMIIVSALAPAQQQTRDLRSLVVIKLQVAGQCRPCGVPSSWVFRITNVIAKITIVSRDMSTHSVRIQSN